MECGRLQVFAMLHGILLAGCSSPITFTCADDSQCAPDGRCVDPGFCAYPSDDCDEGWAFSPHAGAYLAGDCVDPSTAATTGSTTTGTSVSTSLSTSGTSSTTAETTTETDTTPAGTGTTTVTPPDDKLILWLPFDDDFASLGGATDAGPLSIQVGCGDGQCPDSVDGVVGKAGQFWGGQLLKIDSDPAFAFDGPFTIAMFARDDSTPSGDSKTLIGKPVSPNDSANILEFLLYASGNGPPRELSAAIQAPDWTPTRVEIETPLVQQEWHHLAMVWDGDMLEMYVDGQSVGSSPGPAPSTDLQPIAIGGDLNFGSPENLWEGAIDELRIYDRALSPADIENLANAQ